MKGLKDEHLCVLTFVLCAALNFGLSTVGWDHNLIEGHEFRQTQTALTVRALQREGWQLAYPLPLFGPPWSAPMEFPLYQICVAGVSSITGCAIEPAGRGVSLAFFYLSLPAFFLLLRHLGIPLARRFLFLGLLLVTPVYFYYSRAFMIESTALCACAWFLQAYCRALESRRWPWIAAAVLLGSIAALAKSTTFLVFLVPAAWFTLTRANRGSGSLADSNQAGRGWLGFLIVLVPLALGSAWMHFADGVKASNPLSQFLVSDRLKNWNFGPLAERLQASFWTEIFTLATRGILLLPEVLFFLAFVFIVSRTHRLKILGLVGCYLAGPLAFANLYAIHDYYHYATGVFLLAALTLALCGLLDLPGGWRPGKWVVIFATICAHLLAYNQLYFFLQSRPASPQPELGEVLRAVTEPNDILLIYGLEWNPLVPYAADRQAIMVTGENLANEAAQEEVIGRVATNRIGALVLVGDKRLDRDFCARLIQRHDFAPDPLLVSDDTAVYLAKSLQPAAARRLRKFPLRQLALNLPHDAEIEGVKVWRHTGDELAQLHGHRIFSIQPTEILTPFGIGLTVENGREQMGAHAPTEIVFDLPPGLHALRADYGLAPQSYLNRDKTDGVEVRIELRQAGQITVLFDRLLSPATQLADRGVQHLAVSLPAKAQGHLVLCTLPGPARNMSFDWAYWSAVKIQ